jgi:hypothetical protein
MALPKKFHGKQWQDSYGKNYFQQKLCQCKQSLNDAYRNTTWLQGNENHNEETMSEHNTIWQFLSQIKVRAFLSF